MRAGFHSIRVCLTLIILAGCGDATERIESTATHSGFLSDYSILEQGGEGEAALVYWNADADFAAYDKILIEPVTIWAGPDSDLRTADPQDRQRLTDAFYSALHNKLSSDFQLVTTPGPGVMRLRAAVTDASSAYAALDTATTYLPPARVVSSALNLAVGSDVSAFVAEASIEAELTDAATGEQLGAVVDRRAGTKALDRDVFSAWSDVNEAFDAWATQLSANLDNRRRR